MASSIGDKGDFESLRDLARSRDIEVVEAQGLYDKNGIRFQQNGRDFIALNPILSEAEKVRTLGFFLESFSETEYSETDLSMGAGQASSSGETGELYFYSLSCPSV